MLNAVKKYVSGHEYDLKDWAMSMTEEMKYTPDYWRLCQQPMHPLFVYGDEQTGHERNVMLGEDAQRYATGFTIQDYAVYKKKLGKLSFPIALEPTPHTPSGPAPLQRFAPRSKVKGELFLVTTKTLKELDIGRENGVQFLRRKVAIHIPHLRFKKRTRNFGELGLGLDIEREQTFRNDLAWIYVGNPEYWDKHIDAGHSFSPVRVFEPKNKSTMNHYASFTTLEYRDL